MDKINPNTRQHGKAAAAALLHELENPSQSDPDRARELGVVKIAAYLEGYRHAPQKAREGFAHIMCDFLVDAVDGTVTSAGAYERAVYNGGRRGANRSERKAHARVWLKGGAK